MYSHVDVEAEVVGGVEEVIANEVDQGEQDADKENLQSEGDITDKEVEVEEGEEEGHLIDDEEWVNPHLDYSQLDYPQLDYP